GIVAFLAREGAEVPVRAASERRRVLGEWPRRLERHAGVTVGAANGQLRIERLRRIHGRPQRTGALCGRVDARGALQDLTVDDRSDDPFGEQRAAATDT